MPSVAAPEPVAAALEYAGFWIRVLASLIDTVLVVCLIYPIAYAVYGGEYFSRTGSEPMGLGDFLLSWVLPAAAVIAFWVARQATPGKMAVSAYVVDEKTGGSLTIAQSIGRYVGYFVSAIPFGLGFIWVAFDRRKQGWHDKMAGSVVIRRRRGVEPVRFDRP